MTYLTDDVGTTTRLRMTPTRTLRAWERTGGVCVICNQRIDGVKQTWFVEHIRALELGGPDIDSNLGPAHFACKSIKDADDHSRAAKAKRAKRAELGVRVAAPQPITSPGFGRSPKAAKREQRRRDRAAMAAHAPHLNRELGSRA